MDEPLTELVEEPFKIRWRRGLILKFFNTVYEGRSDMVMSVWGRCYAGEPGSCTLKACSSSFADRFGLAKPRCLKYTEMTLAPEVARLTENERAAALATREALYAIARSMQVDKIQQGRGTIATISLSGKVSFTHLHIVCLRHTRDEPHEYLAAEMPLNEGDELEVNFKSTIALDAQLHVALNPPKRRTKAAQVQQKAGRLGISNPEIASRHHLSNICLMCGLEGSLVMRAGPSGPATLCNTCGIKFMNNSFVKVERVFEERDGPEPEDEVSTDLLSKLIDSAASPPIIMPEIDSEFCPIEPIALAAIPPPIFGFFNLE